MARHRVENVALLGLLNDILSEPRENPLPPPTGDEDHRILSLKQEKRLASVAAFLANVTGKVHYVMAACFEENPAPRRLKLVLAINLYSDF